MRLDKQLVRQLSRGTSLSFAIGVVTHTSPLTVRINGDTTEIADCSKLAGYTPVVDDVVFVLRPGPSLLVLDAIS